MQLTCTIALGSLATLAAAAMPDKRNYQYLDFVPMERRQATGAEYECHASCGYTIINAEEDGYCDSSEWKQLLEDCLACANDYDMWGDYGSGVEAAAEGCGIDAVPEGSASSASSAAASTAAATTPVTSGAAVESSAANVASSTAAPSETAEASDNVVETSAETAIETAVTSAMVTPSASVPASGNTTSTASAASTSVEASAAAQSWFSGILVAGAAIAAIANLM